MLGDFSLCSENARISIRDNRSKKVWLLLSYLLCKRGHPVSRNELIRIVWNNASNDNPENALKTTLHRARSTLNQLWPDAGHELILWKNGCYSWNTDIPVSVDADEFLRFAELETSDESVNLQNGLNALELYKGDFLSAFSSEIWLIPLTTYYHNLYIQTLLNVIPLLFARKRYQEAADLCRNASRVEPYHEPLHGFLMEALLKLGDLNGLTKVYEDFSKRLFADMGIQPGDDLKAIYRSAVQPVRNQTLSIDEVLQHLQETDKKTGALQCEFDHFKILCHAESRNMARTGNMTHLSVFTVSDGAKPLSRKSLDTTMERLGEQIRLSLRRGDTFARCSISQYIIMIPHADYDNSCMVSRKILTAFTKRYPHCPAKIDFAVQPLEPQM